MLRAFNFCVIDEVDSILIDEARTPLIISGTAGVGRLLDCQRATPTRLARTTECRWVYHHSFKNTGQTRNRILRALVNNSSKC